MAALLRAGLSPVQAQALGEISTPYLPSISNFRDVAGISSAFGGTGYVNMTTSGGVMRTGVFYRSTELGDISPGDLTILSGLGITRVIDLRTPSEIAMKPDIPPTGASEVNHNIYNTFLPASPTIDPAATVAANVASVRSYSYGLYRDFVINQANPGEQAALRAVLLDLAATQGPMLYHCSGGKDRTGWVSAILGSIAGVPPTTIISDYMATNLYTADWINSQLALIPLMADWPIYRPLLGVEADFLQAGLDQVTATYGSMHAYLTRGLGLTQADIYVLRGKMVYYPTLPGQSAMTGNAAAGAALLNGLQESPLSGRYTAFNFYLQSAVDAGTLGGVETRVGGQVHADAAAYLLRQPQVIDNGLRSHAFGGSDRAGEIEVWATAIVEHQEASGGGGIAGSEDQSTGVLLGATRQPTPRVSAYWAAGFLADEVDSAGAEADLDSVLLVLGGRYALSTLANGPYLGCRFNAGWLDYRSNRPLGYGLGTASGSTDGITASGRLDLGTVVDLGTVTLRPQVGILVAHVSLDGFAEQGSELALKVDSLSRTTPSALAELHVDFKERQLGGWLVLPWAMVGYEHLLNSVGAASSSELYGFFLSQESAYASQDLAKVGAGLSVRHEAFSLQVGAVAIVGEDSRSTAGAQCRLSYRF